MSTVEHDALAHSGLMALPCVGDSIALGQWVVGTALAKDAGATVRVLVTDCSLGNEGLPSRLTTSSRK